MSAEIIIRAAYKGNLDHMKYVLSQRLIDCRDTYGRSPLNIACRQNNSEIVLFLILQGANLNLQNDYGATPLVTSCYKNNYLCVQYLIEANADLNIQTQYGATALMVACKKNYPLCAEKLIAAGALIDKQWGNCPDLCV